MAAPVQGCRVCWSVERLPRGNTELQLHQIETRNQFRDRMLDLKARIHLEEVVRPGR